VRADCSIIFVFPLFCPGNNDIAIRLDIKEGDICTTPARALERPVRRSSAVAAEV